MNSERLIFSHYTTSDFDEYFQLVSNADVMKMITGRPLLEDETRKRFEVMLKINQDFPKIGHFKISPSAEKVQLNLENLNTGIFVAIITSEGKQLVKKIVKD